MKIVRWAAHINNHIWWYMTIYDDILSLSYMIIIHTHLFLRIAPPLVIVEDCFEKLFLKNILFEDGMETCRVLNLFKRKAERFWVDWHFQRKVETFRMLEGPPRLSLSLPPDSRRKFTFCKNKKCNIFWSWECWSSYCRMLNRE